MDSTLRDTFAAVYEQERPRRGEYDAGALFERYAPQIRRFIVSRVGDGDLADDLLADTFERVVRNLDTYEDRDWPVSAWIYAIARARIIDELRQQRRRPSVPIEPGHARIDGPEDAVAQLMTQHWVRDAIRTQLSGGQRAVIWLRFVRDLTLDETSERLGLSVGAVKALQSRGIAALRSVIVLDEAMTPMMVAFDAAVRKQSGDSSRPQRPLRSCRTMGCARGAWASGLCERCYQRERRTGVAIDPARACQTDGCERTVYSRGLCHRHYYAQRRQQCRAAKPCRAPGCRKPRHSHGYCLAHYEAWQRGTDADHVALHVARRVEAV